MGAKVGVKAKVAVKKPAAKVKVAVKGKAGLKVKIGTKKPAVKGKAGLKVKIGAKKPKVKVTVKKSAFKWKIGKAGWVLGSGQKLQDLDTSFTAFIKAKQAGAWKGHVKKDCA